MPKSDPGANRAGSFMEVEPGAPHLRESVMMKDEPDTAEFNPKKPFFSHLYKRVGPSVGPSVRPSVNPFVTRYFQMRENACFRPR